MKIVLILILIILVAVVLLKSSRPSGKTRAPARSKSAKKSRVPGSATPPAAGKHRSVSISCGPDACEAARSLADKRLLVGELGKLPLPDCDSPNCNCKFVHHNDRRSEEGDQRAISGLGTDLYHTSGKPERREKKGRRKTDLYVNKKL